MRNRVGVDIAANDRASSDQPRRIGQNARSRTHVQHARARLHITFDGLQAKLRRRMAARSASHARIDFQAQATRRSGVRPASQGATK